MRVRHSLRKCQLNISKRLNLTERFPLTGLMVALVATPHPIPTRTRWLPCLLEGNRPRPLANSDLTYGHSVLALIALAV
jgi:hypothetical protein